MEADEVEIIPVFVSSMHHGAQWEAFIKFLDTLFQLLQSIFPDGIIHMSSIPDTSH